MMNCLQDPNRLRDSFYCLPLCTHGYACRQWDDPNYGGTRVSYDKKQFVEKVSAGVPAPGLQPHLFTDGSAVSL